MKKMIIKLDDIGCDLHKPTFDFVAWALYKKIPVSLGTIGIFLREIPRELQLILKAGIELGLVEIWNHGNGHIRYDNATPDQRADDFMRGHNAIQDVLDINARGFGFPYNRFTEQAVAELRRTYGDYFIYETDFENYKQFTPEYNVFADGQPSVEAFHQRIQRATHSQSIIIQAHPPRWSAKGTENFMRCMEWAVDEGGFVCTTAEQALIDDGVRCDVEPKNKFVLGLSTQANAVAKFWIQNSADYKERVGGFDSFLVPKFESECKRNFVQISRRLFPYIPKKVLDVKSGLGNWSLGFALADADVQLTLNENNGSLANALRDALGSLPTPPKVSIEEKNLLGSDPRATVGDHVDLVVGGSFNYLDPVSFFALAAHRVQRHGRLVLVNQTGDFSNSRLANATKAKNHSAAFDVLASEFAMLLRRTRGLVTTGMRHAFRRDEVALLAYMFSFDLIDAFLPIAEMGKKQPTYECLIFRQGLGRPIDFKVDKEWNETYRERIKTLFGMKAFEYRGLSDEVQGGGPEVPFFSDWSARQDGVISPKEIEIKRALDLLKSNALTAAQLQELKAGDVRQEIREFVEKIEACWSSLAG